MNDAVLDHFRSLAQAMGINPWPETAKTQAWIWEKDGQRLITTEARAKRYAAEAGGRAFPDRD